MAFGSTIVARPVRIACAEEGSDLQDELRAITGSRTVPQVFIAGARPDSLIGSRKPLFAEQAVHTQSVSANVKHTAQGSDQPRLCPCLHDCALPLACRGDRSHTLTHTPMAICGTA